MSSLPSFAAGLGRALRVVGEVARIRFFPLAASSLCGNLTTLFFGQACEPAAASIALHFFRHMRYMVIDR